MTKTLAGILIGLICGFVAGALVQDLAIKRYWHCTTVALEIGGGEHCIVMHSSDYAEIKKSLEY